MKTKSTFSTLFGQNEGPEILAESTSADNAVLSLYVSDKLSWFDGHFPQQKVLPGVVQIDWAGKIGKAVFAGDRVFSQLTNIKFKSMVLPDTRMTLELRFNAEKGTLAFHYFNESDSFSTGSFKFIPS
ncbi:thioester dehydrase [Alteromonas sp. H39]|uniref:ApeI family dehydratase n=1 Tax=Alteromonas sp. H39 TaxID=3389876 RepID=UPI0039E15E85